MAENKRTFIAHCKWIHPVKKLSNEEAGRLFKHLLTYVNGEDDDEDPEAPDRLTEIMFEPMKQELKIELIKWRAAREKFVQAGKASAEARAKNKKVQRKATTLNVEQTPTSLKEPEVGKPKRVRPKRVIKEVVRGPNDVINLAPFTEEFRPHWQRWLDYKLSEFKMKYKRLDTEQAQFNVLLDVSGRNQEVAAKIIERSIANTWKGLFKINDNDSNQKNIGLNSKGTTGTNRLGSDFDKPL